MAWKRISKEYEDGLKKGTRWEERAEGMKDDRCGREVFIGSGIFIGGVKWKQTCNTKEGKIQCKEDK